jgi:hypothetical protein
MKLLIDGYNLFKNIFRKSELSLQEKDSLLQKLIDYSEKKQFLIYLVFDGGELPHRYVERHHFTTIINAGSYKKADPLIIDLMSELTGEVVLITSDRELINKAKSHSIETIAPLDFAPLFTKPLGVTSTKRRLKNKPSKLPDSLPSSIDEIMEQATHLIIEKQEEVLKPSYNTKSDNKKISLLLKRLSL